MEEDQFGSQESQEEQVESCVFSNPSLLGNFEPDGQHLPCHLYQGQSVPLETVTFGNVKNESLTKIWNKKEYLDFRKHFNPEILGIDRQAQPNLPQCCRTCHKCWGL